MTNNITDLLQVSMNQIREMIDANTIIGTPLHNNDVTIIPVSKLFLGFVSGGTDIKGDSNKEPLFGGGTGGGVSVTPVAFIVVKDKEVEILSVNNETHLVEKLIDLIPKSIDKAKTLFNNNAMVEKI